jgi:predicted DCC family thiol-disulfide oxidoreductase YuxK
MTFHKPTLAETPPPRDTLIYDGGCPFCTETSRQIQKRSRRPIDILPFDHVAGTGLLASLSPAEVETSVHFVTTRGIEFHGGEAAVQALGLVPGGFVLKVFELPGLNYVREAGYEIIAQMRPVLSKFIHP